MTFRTITLKIPDTLTADEELFIVKSAMNQIDSLLGIRLAPPDAEITKHHTDVDAKLKENALPEKYSTTIADPKG